MKPVTSKPARTGSLRCSACGDYYADFAVTVTATPSRVLCTHCAMQDPDTAPPRALGSVQFDTVGPNRSRRFTYEEIA